MIKDQKRALAMGGLAATIALLVVLVIESLFMEPSSLHWTNDPSTGLAVIGLSFGLGIVGAVLCWNRSDHSIGWLMVAFSATFAAQLVFEEFAIVAFREGNPSLSAWLVFGLNVSRAVAFPLLATLMIVFPSGRPASGRWVTGLWVVWSGAAVALTLAPFTAYEWTSESVLPALHTVEAATNFEFLVSLPVLVAMVLAGVRIVLLLVRGTQVERRQVRWISFTLALVAALLALSLWLPVAAVLAGIVAAVGIPLSIGVAITKYRLYDIDMVISRSLSFSVLVVFIGAVYVGIVVGLGELFGGSGSSGLWLSVGATAVVAIAFQSARVRVESWANRLVYGKRATPYEVLSSFSHRAVDESDEDVLGRIPQLMVDGTGATEAVMWVRSRDGFKIRAAWPETGMDRRLQNSDVFVDPASDVSFPVYHDGELLGGVSLVAARGGVITPPEHDLVESLADGLGLTLRNSLLTSQLRRQVKDLQRSRDRVVSASDEARRSLEHALDSGPLQQLVAVKVKLGPLRKMAEQAGAVRVAGVLADIEVQASDAIRAVRDFAAGVYPPLLGAEGLVVALTQETRRAAVPVVVEAGHVGRFPREIEAAVYFSILEALQNTAKYAEASQATVRLTAVDGLLVAEVSDDGKGFDSNSIVKGAGLNGIADRIDTVGGTTTITSIPGKGTVVIATIPIADGRPEDDQTEGAPAEAAVATRKGPPAGALLSPGSWQ